MDDEQTSMLESTLELKKIPNENNNDDTDWRQWQCCCWSGCDHLAIVTSCLQMIEDSHHIMKKYSERIWKISEREKGNLAKRKSHRKNKQLQRKRE
jgi:hypothetical protein